MNTDIQPGNAPSILVVDDDPDVIKLATDLLRREGYEVRHAANGREGLEIAQKAPPDLILLDILMPEMDGWEMIRRLRILPDFAFTPVIFLTSLSDISDRIRGFQSGADDYLEKNLLFEELVYRVKKVLFFAEESRVAAAADFEMLKEATRSFSGSLSEYPLVSLLSLCKIQEVTGILHLVHAQGHQGSVKISGGEVASAQCSEKKRLKNKKAIFKLVTWDEGTFELEKLPGPIPLKLGMSTRQVLTESIAQLNQEKHP